MWTKQTTATLCRAIRSGKVPPARRFTMARAVMLRMTAHATPPCERVRMARMVWFMYRAGWPMPARCGHATMELIGFVLRCKTGTPAELLAAARFVMNVERELYESVFADFRAILAAGHKIELDAISRS